MKKTTLSLAISSALLAPVLAAPSAMAEGSFADAIKNGEANLSLRMRYEDVDVDTNAAADEAQALTLKTRLNFKASSGAVTGFIEVDDVTALDDTDYNSTTNGNGGKAVIADPESTEVNQAWLSYTYNDTTAKYGRQRIAMDNHRFIGTVGWRQNEQTYDALTLVNTSLSDTTVTFGRISNVNRIFSESHAAGDVEHETNFLNVKFTGLSAGALVAYAIQMDAEDSNAAFDSWDTDTYGLRFSGKQDLDSVKLGYTVEWATQSDADDNAASYDAEYLLLEGSLSAAGVTLTLGQETLGADDGDGVFITPFATLHKFQGWTDQFLGGGTGNIAGGIVDQYVSVGTVLGGVKLLAVYHDFTSDDEDFAAGMMAAGDDDLGDEWGFVVAKKFGGNYNASLKYASYDAGDRNSSDVDKIWFTLGANF